MSRPNGTTAVARITIKFDDHGCPDAKYERAFAQIFPGPTNKLSEISARVTPDIIIGVACPLMAPATTLSPFEGLILESRRQDET